MMVQCGPKGADGVVAHTEKLRCERPPQRRLRLRIPSFVRRGLVVQRVAL